MGYFFEIDWAQLLLPRRPLAGFLLAGAVVSLALYTLLRFQPRRQTGNAPQCNRRQHGSEELRDARWEADGGSNAIEARETVESSPKAECEDRELAALRAVGELRRRLRWHRQQVARIEEALSRYDE